MTSVVHAEFVLGFSGEDVRLCNHIELRHCKRQVVKLQEKRGNA
jgi:hypothetical protein